MSQKFDQEKLSRLAELALNVAKQHGADQTEVGLSGSDGVSINVRLGDVETIEKDRSQSMGVTVYKNGAKGSASTTDLSETAIQDAVQAACSIASYSEADEYAGLAAQELMAKSLPDLDLYHPWDISIEEAIDKALICEATAREASEQISNSEGASFSSHQGLSIYANSHGFLGAYQGTRHSMSCSVLAEDKSGMQRDYGYSMGRVPSKLDSPEEVGAEAARKTLARLSPQKLQTCEVPVLYSPEMSRSLLGHFIGAIRGGSLYRKASFLLDKQGEKLFPDFVRIYEQPYLKQGLGSGSFDSEGVQTNASDIVSDGILERYVLDSYAARRLGMETTANAGGVRNLTIQPGTESLDELLKKMDKGVFITELMGSGANGVTGDYSRGASGFWVENGEIQYPVAEITVAGNLLDMYANIVALGNDVNTQSNTQTPSILLDGLTVAGAG